MSQMRFSDDEGFARAWAAFTRHDGAQGAPPGLEARVRRSVAARRVAAVGHEAPRESVTRVRAALAVAACVVAALAAGWLAAPGRLASILPGLPPGPLAEWPPAAMAMPLPASLDRPAPRPVSGAAADVRPVPVQVSRPLLATLSADGPLQVIRVRIAASALDAFGVAVAGPIATGLVDVDLVVSADGWPMDVRRIRPVTADGPLQ
jgi:hypothetical protein